MDNGLVSFHFKEFFFKKKSKFVTAKKIKWEFQSTTMDFWKISKNLPQILDTDEPIFNQALLKRK